MKKKLTAFFLCAVMLLTAGCAGTSDASSGDASGDSTTSETTTDGDESGDSIMVTELPDYDALDYVELGTYLGVEVEVTQYAATEDEYEEYILNICEGCAYYPESDKTEVEDGDLVNIDYVGTIDDEEFSGGSAEGYDLEIGSGSFIDDFEEQLIGTCVGDVVEVEVTFPDTYSSEDLAGQDAVFTVTINYICESEEVVPDYTDDLVYEYTSGEYETTEAYDEYVWAYLEDQAEYYTSSALETAVQSAVLNNCEITSIPDGMVGYYVYVYYQQDAYYADYYGVDFETYIALYGYSSEEDYLEALEEQVTESLVPVYLVQEAIIEAEEMEVTDEAVESFLEDYAEYYGYDDLDSLLDAYGCTTSEDFISLVGEDSFNSACLNFMVWDMCEEAAVVTYIEESTDSEEE